MEQEFKNRILDYLVGNIDKETQPDNAPQILELNRTVADLRDVITNNGLKILGNTISQNSLMVFYGYLDSDNTKGFIMLTDINYNFIELFTTYQGGTTLPRIDYLIQEDDGTFFAISTPYENGAYTGKIILLNNFTLTLTGAYTLKFNYNYNLSTELLNALNSAGYNGSQWYVLKKREESKYLIISQTNIQVQGNNQFNLDIATLQINVGSENDWTYSQVAGYPVQGQYSYVPANKLYCEWNGDNYRIKYGYSFIANNTEVYYEQKILNGVAEPIKTYQYNVEGYPRCLDIIMNNYDKTYLSIVDEEENNNFNVIYLVTNNTINKIYNAENTGYEYNFGYISLFNYNNFIIGKSSDGNSTTFYFVDDNGAYIIGNEAIPYDYNFILIYNSFNLYEILLAPTNYSLGENLTTIYSVKSIFNYNNYNGVDYCNINSTIPNYASLLDDNGKLIFARNLYNASINLNTTESTLEIPNVYLNDNIIKTQNLYSKTNSLLNSNEQEIIKNIYETLYINFFNTINIKNANDPNNIIINIPGASRLNGSISGYNNYENVKIGLIKVNYNDNTNLVIPEFKLTQNSTTNYTISFNIYVPKEITNIQILSEDGNTVYQTITTPLEVGKYYKITQDVRIV